MLGFELRLFGEFEVRSQDGQPVIVAPKKARALLAYLGCQRGKFVTRDALSSLFWGDISAEEQARRSLRQALTVLRRELPEEVLETRRDGVLLRPSVDVDVARFEHGIAHTEPNEIERALRLYRGDLLEGFSARASGFDDWLERERRRLKGLATDGMRRVCESQRARGDTSAAIATAMRLIATDPVFESGHRLLMELYVETGRASEAVRQYESLRALLAEKLGTAPDAQTTDLVERIRRSNERRQTSKAPAFAAAASVGPELRQVTVLAIALRTGRFDAAIERDVEVILARYGGGLTRVGEAQALGIFGFPRAHDNDVERAVRAALALCRLEPLATRLSAGVASGPVLVEYGAQKPALQGDVIGRAAALSHGEEPGVIVSSAVARTLGQRLESQPTQYDADARLAIRLLESASFPIATPLAGRRYELAQLTAALEYCRESGRGRTFIVRGEAGIGKTRLLRALCEAALERGVLVHARSVLDFGDDAQESPVLGIVRELLAELQERGTPQLGPRPRELLEDADLGVLLEMVRAFTHERAGTEAGGRALTLRRRRDAASRLLAERCTQAARLIWVDDIHWADSETLAQIAAWIDVAAQHPLLLVVTTRIEGEPDTAAFRSAVRGRPVTTLDLPPLTPEEASELITTLEPSDARSAELVLARAGGNPLFIEQLVRWPRMDRVPDSVCSLVQARSDQLNAEARAELQAAAVLGQQFTLPALSQLLEQEPQSLAELAGQSLIHEHADGYRFAHALVRDAIYDGLPKDRRCKLHMAAARYYAGRDAALHAQHLDCAGDEGAAAAYVRAALAERRAGNAERALELCLRGRELAERGRDRHTAALLAGELSIDLGRSAAALEAFDVAEASASDALDRARVHVGRAAALRLLDRSKEALLELAAAERLVDPQRDAELMSRIHYLRGNVLFPLGDSAACLESQTLALEAARRTGSLLAEAQALSGLADAHFMAGRRRAARTCFAQCERAARELGNLELELTSSGMQYLLDLYDLSVRGSAIGCQQTADRARSGGALRAETVARLSSARAFLLLGDWSTALAEAQRSITLSDELGARRFSALGISYAALARAALGDRQSAAADLSRALSHAENSSLGFAGAAVYAALLVTAEPDRVEAVLDEADTVLRTTSLELSLVLFVQHGMEAALKLGQPARAVEYGELLEKSMAPEPHRLGNLIVDFGRTLANWHHAPSAEHTRREVERLRAELDAAGMRPALSFVDQLISGSPSAEWRRGKKRSRERAGV